MPQHNNDQVTDRQYVIHATVEEAAKLLGLSENAVRKRIERGTLRSEKVEGIRYILLDSDMSQHADDMPSSMPGDIALIQAHLDSMREQLDYLKSVIEKRDEEIRRKDHLLAAALERIPAIEAPQPDQSDDSDARESTLSASETEAKGAVSPDQTEGEIRRSWWQRLFGY